MTCIQCKKHFINSQAFARHRCTDQTSFACEICKKKLKSKQGKKIHEQKCSYSKRKQKPEINSCEKCKKQFNTKKKEIQHALKCFPCEKCSRTFISQIKLDRHCCATSAIECSTCKRNFNSKRALHNHKSMCEGQFRCLSCKKRYTNQLALDCHPCKLKCQKCQEVFVKAADKAKHECILQFTCQLCNKSFKTHKAFGKHICKNKKKASHVVCSRCNAACSNRHELNLHIREVHLQRGTGEKVQVEIDNPEIKAF